MTYPGVTELLIRKSEVRVCVQAPEIGPRVNPYTKPASSAVKGSQDTPLCWTHHHMFHPLCLRSLLQGDTLQAHEIQRGITERLLVLTVQ